jgi:hypothetical protein
MPKHTRRSSGNKQTKKIKSDQLVKSVASRKLVECNCDQCNGKKVDLRTRKRHGELEEKLKDYAFESSRPAKKHGVHEVHEVEKTQDEKTPIFSSSSSSDDDKGQDWESKKPGSRNRYDKFHNTDTIEINQDIESDQSSSLSNEEELFYQSADDELTEEEFYDEDEITFDRFSASDLNDIDGNPDPEHFDISNSSANFGDLWILLWIFKYQDRFRLSDVATDALIKFFRLVLLDADKKRFNNFPSSEYVARKLLEIGGKTKMFAVCPACNKLHNTDDRQDGFKCDHVEFPTHPRQN